MLFSQNDDGVTCLMHSTESGRAEAVEGIVEAMEIQAKRFKVIRATGATFAFAVSACSRVHVSRICFHLFLSGHIEL